MANVEHDAREAVLREVGETLMAIESALGRAQRAAAALPDGTEPNIRLALERVATRLDDARRSLYQDAHLAGSQQQLL